MDEHLVKALGQIVANAIEAVGMHYENQERLRDGSAIAWSEASFGELADATRQVVASLKGAQK
jgi:hypothetical protein